MDEKAVTSFPWEPDGTGCISVPCTSLIWAVSSASAGHFSS